MSFHQKGALKKHSIQTLEQVRTVILSSTVITVIIHIYHFHMLSLVVWQDRCHTYKNLVYDLAHHESPIAQWLERPTGIWKVMGLTPIGGWENSFSGYFDLRTLLHYLLFIQVTNSIYQATVMFSPHVIGEWPLRVYPQTKGTPRDCTFMNGLFDYWNIGHIPGITSRFNIHVVNLWMSILRSTLHQVWLLYIGVQLNALEYFKDKNMYGC